MCSFLLKEILLKGEFSTGLLNFLEGDFFSHSRAAFITLLAK
jgi:hypothetical protein